MRRHRHRREHARGLADLLDELAQRAVDRDAHPAPEGEVPAQPIGRLTPKFHDITIENVTATGSNSAGTIVGLPESPVLGLTLKNVHLAAKTGLAIAYATVVLDTGEAIKIAPTAKVTQK